MSPTRTSQATIATPCPAGIPGRDPAAPIITGNIGDEPRPTAAKPGKASSGRASGAATIARTSAGGRDERPGPDDGRAAPPVDPAVVREPPEDHRAHVHHERRRGDARRLAQDVGEVDGAPRRGRALDRHAQDARAARSARGPRSSRGARASGSASSPPAGVGGVRDRRGEQPAARDQHHGRDDAGAAARWTATGTPDAGERSRRRRRPPGCRRSTCRGSPAGSTGRTGAGGRSRARSSTRPSSRRTCPGRASASASVAHDDARPTATSAAAARVAGDGRPRGRSRTARSGRPAKPPASSPPTGIAASAIPSSPFVSAEAVLDRGRAGQDRGGDRAVREEQRAHGDPGGAGAAGARGSSDHRAPPMVPEVAGQARSAAGAPPPGGRGPIVSGDA